MGPLPFHLAKARLERRFGSTLQVRSSSGFVLAVIASFAGLLWTSGPSGNRIDPARASSTLQDPSIPPLGGLRWTDVSAESLPARARGSASSMDAEVADLNGDGHLDVVVAVEFGRNFILQGDGAGGFTDATPDAFDGKAHDSEDVAIADFDGDGRLDLVFVSEDDRVDEHYRGDGQGGFEHLGSLPLSEVSNAVLALDVDLDGDMDLIVGNAGQNRLLLNDGRGAFEDGTSGRLPERLDQTQDVEAGDVNGDGLIDLVFGNEDANRLLFGQGEGRFEEAGAGWMPGGIGEETREAELGDVDGDGDLDLIFANVVFQVGTDARNRLLFNDGSGQLREDSDALPAARLNTVDSDLVDLDGDGDLDMLQSHAFGGGPQVLENDGSGHFTNVTRQTIGLASWDGIDVEAFDADGDGLLDLYWTHYNSGDRLMIAQAPPSPPTLHLPWLYAP